MSCDDLLSSELFSEICDMLLIRVQERWQVSAARLITPEFLFRVISGVEPVNSVDKLYLCWCVISGMIGVTASDHS